MVAGKRGERSAQRGERGEELFRMAALPLQQVTEHGNMRIDGIQKPEICDVRRREVGQAEVLLPPAGGKLRTLGGENFQQPVDQAEQKVAGAYFEQGRNKAGIEPEDAGIGAFHVGDAQGGASFASLIGRQQTQILARDLDRLLSGPGVFVDHGRDLRQDSGSPRSGRRARRSGLSAGSRAR